MDLTAGKIAHVAHEAYRAYKETLGANAPSWGLLPQNEKDALIANVLYIQENQNAKPEDLHKFWVEFKKAQGWDVRYKEEEVDGKIIKTLLPKNRIRKINPMLRDYEELTPEDQFKNYLLISVVRSFEDLVTLLNPPEEFADFLHKVGMGEIELPEKEEPAEEAAPEPEEVKEPSVEVKEEAPKPKPKKKTAGKKVSGADVATAAKDLRVPK